jgi:AraC-like DNA-binding protein
MTAGRHLILQEIIVPPSEEWLAPAAGWTLARVAEGAAYILQGQAAREINAGDGFAAAGGSRLVVRASRLGPVRLIFFHVHPEYLNGFITVAEDHELEQISKCLSEQAIAFTAKDPIGQKFARLTAPPQRDNLAARSALLQLWSQIVSGAFRPKPAASPENRTLLERFRQLLAQMPDAELATRSLPELAGQLQCSERHFSRIFRKEFGVPLRVRQTQLRLQRACELLMNDGARINSVAIESGYRHLGLFNAMFKKKYGLTPSAWRQKQKSQAGALSLLALLISCLAGA